MSKADRVKLCEAIDKLLKNGGHVPKGMRPVIYLDLEEIAQVKTELRFLNPGVRSSPPVVPPTARKRRPKDLEAAKKLSLEELGIKTKVINILGEKGVNTVGKLLEWVLAKEEHLLELKGFGATSLNQCKARLKAWGFTPE
jgi:DNA-directed RNA polymerase alpha subunit